MNKIYIAYGSNLNKSQMAARCPQAHYISKGILKNWRLVYRGSESGAYASIVREKGQQVPIGLWLITPYDERALDIYEGYPRFYGKKNIYCYMPGSRKILAMAYILPDNSRIGCPSSRYIRTVRDGYRDCGLDMAVLDESLLYNKEEMLSIGEEYPLTSTRMIGQLR